jgi:hypothetical protein
MGGIGNLLTGWLVRAGLEQGLAARLVRWAMLAGGIILLAVVTSGLWTLWAGGKTRAVASRVDGAMAGAGVSNAVDAIGVVQARGAAEDSIERTVTHAQSAIQAASDGVGADAAGRDGLCAIAARFCPAAGVQRAGSR